MSLAHLALTWNEAFALVNGAPAQPHFTFQTKWQALLIVVEGLQSAATDTTNTDAIAAINAILTANGITLTSDHENRIVALEP